MDITNAYVYEQGMHSRPIYVLQLAYSDGHYPYGRTSDRLNKNLWGGKTAMRDYLEALFAFLRKYGYDAAYVDPFLISKTIGTNHIFVEITVDDFLVVASKQDFIE